MEENIGHKQTIKTEPIAPLNDDWRAHLMPTIRHKIVIFFLHTKFLIFIFLFKFLIFILSLFFLKSKKEKKKSD